MEIYLDQITKFYPWKCWGKIEFFEPNTRILKELSHPTQIEKFREQVRKIEIEENSVIKDYSNEEIKEIVFEHIKRFFIVDEDNASLTILEVTPEYMVLINNEKDK